MSKLLFDTRPLIINPELACLIGLNESIILQQIHYWIEKKKESNSDFHDGYFWVYNTYEAWQKQFPFWSIRTIKRIFTSLENAEIIISGNYNKLGIDRTKWYTINYSKIEDMRKCHIVTMDVPQCHNPSCQVDPTITIEYVPKSSSKNLKVLNGSMLEHRSVFNWDILEKQIIKSCNNQGIQDYSAYIDIIQYYYSVYMETFKKEHPRLSESAMNTVVDNLYAGTDLIQDVDIDIYHAIIDQHFKTQYTNCDYSICHFMTEGIRNNRFYESC